MKIINKEFLTNAVQRLKTEIMTRASEQSIDIDLLFNQVFGYPLNVYILLTYMLSFIKLDEDFSKEDIFYNRYLWFTRFAKLKEKQEGYSPGINQQSVRLMEEVDYNELKIDWNIIQKISDELDMEIS